MDGIITPLAIFCYLDYRGDMSKQGGFMLHPLVPPVTALICGILILVFPEVLNLVVGIYLVAIGIIGILGHM